MRHVNVYGHKTRGQKWSFSYIAHLFITVVEWLSCGGEERGEAWSQLKSPGRPTMFHTWYIPVSQAEHTASRTYIYLQEFLSSLHRFQTHQPLDSWRTFLPHSSGTLQDTQNTHFNDFKSVLLVYTCKKTVMGVCNFWRDAFVGKSGIWIQWTSSSLTLSEVNEILHFVF